MPTRRNPDSWRLWRGEFPENFGILCLIWFFAVGMLGFAAGATGGYAGSIDTHDKAASSRSSLVHLVNSSSPTEREAIARSILTLSAHKVSTAVETGSDTPAHRTQIISQLTKTAHSGSAIALDTRATGWGPYWHFWFWLWLSIFLGGFSIGLFLLYALDSVEDNYLMDLPWRRVWPVFFVALTAFPIGFVFYITSAIRLRHVPAFVPTRARNARHDFAYPYDYDDRAPAVKPPAPAAIGFSSQPQAARQFYTDLRLNGGKLRLERKVQSLRRSISDGEQTLRELGEEIKREQQARSTLMAELRQTEALIATSNESKETDLIQSEFDALLALEGVSGVRVINDMISVKVDVRVPYKGVRYDFGDWEIRVGQDYYFTRRLRSAVNPGWHGLYPDYEWRDGEFCLGRREATISDFIRKGQFLEGIELIVATMHSVNKDDKPNIPRAFSEVNE